MSQTYLLETNKRNSSKKPIIYKTVGEYQKPSSFPPDTSSDTETISSASEQEDSFKDVSSPSGSYNIPAPDLSQDPDPENTSAAKKK